METIDVEYYLWKLADELANKAFHDYCRNIYRKLYLYYEPASKDRTVRVTCAVELPDKFYKLSETAHLPSNISRVQLKNWIYNKLRILPILSV